jgi:NTE family protein
VAEQTPLSSPAIGTATNDLITGCDVRRRHADPPPPPRQPPFALAFSGGGFRATLSAVGVLRFMADAGLLAQVRWVSSVSGGSVAHGLFARAYPELERAGFAREAVDDLVLRPLVARVSRTSLTETLLRNAWRTVGPRTRTELLADQFDEWFFDGLLLRRLSPSCRFIFNASNLSTGVRFGLERDFIGDWVMGRIDSPADFRLATAVAASAAFPGGFAPVVLRGLDFPCADGRVAKLLDGGAYDNMGLEPLDNLSDRDGREDLRDACLVALNAGGVFRTGAYGRLPLVRDLMRANSLLYRQTTALRMRAMVERFRLWERTPPGAERPPGACRGVLFALATTFDTELAAAWRAKNREQSDDERRRLALTKTSFDEFPVQLCRDLIYRGWWLAGAALSQYHPDLLGGLPEWQEPTV